MYSGIAETYFNADTKIWSGVTRKKLFSSSITIGEVAAFALELCPEKVVQVEDENGYEMTAGELLRNGKTLAKSLLRLGLSVGDTVGIVAHNTTHQAAIVLGALLCGAPVNALHPEFDSESVKEIYSSTQPKVIFCDAHNYDIIQKVAMQLALDVPIFLMSGEIIGVRNVKELLMDDGDEVSIEKFPCAKMHGDDTAFILCSSGTTGTPKGVHCSHKAILQCGTYMGVKSDSVMFTFSNLYWLSGVMTLTMSLIAAVKRLITTRPFSNEYFLRLIKEHGATHILTPPYQMVEIAKYASPTTGDSLKSIHTIICGGSKVPSVVADVVNGLLSNSPGPGLVVAYGLSEIGSICSMNDGRPEKYRKDCEGKLLPNVEARILDKNSGQPVGIDNEGILHIRTPNKWSGYHRNAEATRSTYVDGWIITGDVAYFDSEGFLHIKGRDSDVFKWNNCQIYPSKVEDVLLRLPGIEEACIFGKPDFAATNLTSCAIVRTKNNEGQKLTEEDIRTHVEKNMEAIYHIRGTVHFMESLPKTSSGKIQRQKVKEIVQEEL